MTPIESLRQNLSQAFALSDGAIEWLISIYETIQVFDDVVDGGDIERSDFNRALYFCLVGQYQNAFFARSSYLLLPLVANIIFRWQASDIMERRGMADEKSYMLRAGYYDLILQAIYIEHGQDVAASMADKVFSLYGETCAAYLEEFKNA